MQPVEINAGAYYLRALRSDERFDDCADLLAAYSEPALLRYVTPRIDDRASAEEYVRKRAEGWRSDTLYSWAVAEPASGRLLGEVMLKNLRPERAGADIGCWTHPAQHGKGIATTAVSAVLRFGFGALDLHRIAYDHAVSNTASRRVAEKVGLRFEGRLRHAILVGGEREDLLVWSRLATDG